MIKKEFMDQVYHSSRYKPFHFYNDYKNILTLFTEPVINQHYSIELNNKKRPSATFCPVLPLQEHALQLCYWEEKKESNPVHFSVFKETLLQVFLKWIEYFLEISVDHFNIRESEKIKLIQHPIINLSIGNLVSQLAQCRELIYLIKSYEVAIEKIIKILCDLHKLVGGRAFLKGNIIDMLALVNVFKKVYF